MMHASRLLITAVIGVAFAACSGGGSSSTNNPTSFLPGTSHRTHAKHAPSSVACTSIDTLNPNSDFAGLGFTTAVYNGGDNLKVDGTGCTYGIYLYPGAKNLHISRATVDGASRFEIFAEGVTGVTIDHAVVNGAGGTSGGGIAFRGTSGTLSNAKIYNTKGVGINILANSACFNGVGTCVQPNVTVRYTTIDNSKTTGDGIDVIGCCQPQVGTASISNTTVTGANLATPPGRSQVDIYGAQTGFAIFDANVSATYDQSINNQVGFDAYCSTGFTTIADLNRIQHDKVSYQTPVSLTGLPLTENQVLNAFTTAQIDAAFGPGAC